MCYGISFAAYIYVKMQYYTIYFGASIYVLHGWMDEMHAWIWMNARFFARVFEILNQNKKGGKDIYIIV